LFGGVPKTQVLPGSCVALFSKHMSIMVLVCRYSQNTLRSQSTHFFFLAKML
jgi:hypothetical protein